MKMQEKYLDKIQLGIQCTNSYFSSTEALSLLENSTTFVDNQSHALFFIEKTRYDFWRLYFYIQDVSKIDWNFFTGKELMAEIIVRNSKITKWDDLIRTFALKGNFEPYDTFIRLVIEKPFTTGNDVDFSNVQTAQQADLEEIQHLLEIEFDVYSDRIPSLKELKKLQESTFLIKENGKIIAFFITEKSGLTLIFRYWLVLEPYRGKKYGDLLIRRVMTFDPHIVRITSWVSKKLDYSINAHKHLGFKQDGLTNYILYRKL